MVTIIVIVFIIGDAAIALRAGIYILQHYLIG
jgi:hypothetical protein